MEYSSIISLEAFLLCKKEVKVAWVSKVSGEGGAYNSFCALNKTDIE